MNYISNFCALFLLLFIINTKQSGEIAKGYAANLLNLTSMIGQSSNSSIAHASKNWIYLPFNNTKIKLKPVDGMWELKISRLVNNTNEGDKFSPHSYMKQIKGTKNLPMIIIESSIRSNLIATAGSNPKVVFEVINNYDRPVFVPFSVQDEKSMLRNLIPKSAIIPSKGSAEVSVYTTIPASSTQQFTDLITITAHGQERVQKSALLYVNSALSKVLDITLPYLNYKFTSTCMEVSYSSCQSGIWSIEITAQDSESGLLRVVSEPGGLYSPNGYISGTRETVTLYYSSNCCQPNIDITAIDLNNNKRSYSVDAYHAKLSTGSIVAISLGIILLIIIIIIIILLIKKWYKQRDSLDLPRYRSQTGISRF